MVLGLGMDFVGVVKTAPRRYPMKYLSSIELANRGDRAALFHCRDGKDLLLSLVWVDRDRRYFISTFGSLSDGMPYVRRRWRQVADVASNDDPEVLELVVPQPQVCELYYNACAQVDRHNRCRQDDVQLERKIQTQDWNFRVNSSILAMIFVDSWFVWKGALADRCKTSQAELYMRLAEELIDNDCDSLPARRRRAPEVDPTQSGAYDAGVPRSGVGAHLTPTRKRRRSREGTVTAHRQQARCVVCGGKTTHVCSLCREENVDEREVAVCNTRRGRSCFPTHLAEVHRL